MHANISSSLNQLPIAEKLLSRAGTNYYLFHYPADSENHAEVNLETLSLITEKAKKYVICADVLNIAIEDLHRWNIKFRKMPRDFKLLPETVRRKIKQLKIEF